MAGTAHLVGLVLAQFHLMHLVTVEAADVLLAVSADPPLAIGDRMAALANFGRDRQPHLRFVGMIFFHRAVAGFATDAFMRELARLAVELAGMAHEAFPFLALVGPLVQEDVVHRLRMRRCLPILRLLLVAQRATVRFFLFVIGTRGCRRRADSGECQTDDHPRWQHLACSPVNLGHHRFRVSSLRSVRRAPVFLG